MSVENLSQIWPGWQEVEKIGEGSFGKVYKIMRDSHGVTTYAALKLISIPQHAGELASIQADGITAEGVRSYFEEVVTDFVKEIRLMVSLKGAPNIVSIEDYQVVEKEHEIGWEVYIRMELLTSLNDYVKEHKLQRKDIIKLGQDICSALEICSRQNILHRDIKPENIFVSPYGEFKIGDFGIARELEKTTGSLSAKGTYNYMAPEVMGKNFDSNATIHIHEYAQRNQYDNTVDIYSLGLVLYKLLNNNRLPFIDPYVPFMKYQDRNMAIERRLAGEEFPAPVNGGEKLSQVILTACAFEPRRRFQSAQEMKEALEGVKKEKVDVKSKIDVETETYIASDESGDMQLVSEEEQKIILDEQERGNPTIVLLAEENEGAEVPSNVQQEEKSLVPPASQEEIPSDVVANALFDYKVWGESSIVKLKYNEVLLEIPIPTKGRKIESRMDYVHIVEQNKEDFNLGYLVHINVYDLESDKEDFRDFVEWHIEKDNDSLYERGIKVSCRIHERGEEIFSIVEQERIVDGVHVIEKSYEKFAVYQGLIIIIKIEARNTKKQKELSAAYRFYELLDTQDYEKDVILGKFEEEKPLTSEWGNATAALGSKLLLIGGSLYIIGFVLGFLILLLGL